MGDSEGEAFEVTDADLQYAMDPNSRRRMSKNQQIYGVWADREDSEEEESGGRAGFGSGGGRRRGKDMTAPVSFVSGGIKVGSGVTPSDPTTSAPQPKKEEGSDGDLAGDDEVIEIVSRARAKRPAKKAREPQTGFAGLRGPGATQHRQTNKAQGHWEAHTKGIGLKLLKKMGFEEGKGLGKDGQGIAVPVEAVKRQGRGAIGAYGKEHKGPSMDKLRDGESAAIASEEEEEGNAQPKGQWRKTAGRTRRPKYAYRTMEELIAEGGDALRRRAEATGRHATTKVIDMTGRTQKVYDGYDALGTKARAPKDGGLGSKRSEFDVPELTYNLDLLVEMTEDTILKNSRQLRHLKDQAVNIRHEKKELEMTIMNEKDKIAASQTVITLLEEFGEREKAGEVTIEDVAALITRLRTSFPSEYRRWNLEHLSVTNALPLMRTAFEGWEPLSEPTHGLELLSQWRGLLEEDGAATSGGAGRPLDEMGAYERLVWEAWMPCVRRDILSGWSAKEPEPLLRLYETWAELLPAWIRDNLLEQLIFPKIQGAVESWDPLTDTTPIHHWLHPWLAVMGDRLFPVYAPIRHKLAKALSRWHPKDASGLEILRPWKGVFSQGSMDSFISTNIVPKLEVAIAGMGVNPSNQDLDPWKWTVTWAELVSGEILAGVLLKKLFPAWHEALFAWLSCPSPDFTEISEWYRGWKALVPPSIIAVPLIAEQFNYALEMMNQALTGGGNLRRPPTMAQGASAAGPSASSSIPGYQRRPQVAAARGGASVENFRELVERRAHSEGILFMPTRKQHDAKTVFDFGPFLIYIDKAVIFMKKDSKTWSPIGLDQIVEMTKLASRMDDED